MAHATVFENAAFVADVQQVAIGAVTVFLSSQEWNVVLSA